jgi:hypothetical protein
MSGAESKEIAALGLMSNSAVAVVLSLVTADELLLLLSLLLDVSVVAANAGAAPTNPTPILKTARLRSKVTFNLRVIMLTSLK